MIELEAAHLTGLQTLTGGEHSGGGSAAAEVALLEQALRLHVSPQRAIGRHRLISAERGAQVVVMQLRRPTRMLTVLRRERFDDRRGEATLLSGIGAQPSLKRGDRILFGGAGNVEPALDRRGGEAKR